MLPGSKILPINVEVETGHVSVGDSDVLSASLQMCTNTSIHGLHQPRTRNSHFKNPKKIPSKSPDLIVLSDAAQSPVYVNFYFYDYFKKFLDCIGLDLDCF